MYSSYNVKQLKDIGPKCWKEACEQGNKFAPTLLGMSYEDGTYGFPVDLNKAEYYYDIGMKRGDGFSALRMGTLYKMKDKQKSIAYYRKSVDLGWSDALVNLAMILIELKEYEEARGSLKKYFEEVEEPSKSSMYVYACTFMARSYMHDTVNNDDMKEILKYLKLGEHYGGNDLIYGHLGDFYSKGIGVEKNLNRAVYYYSKKGDYYNIGKIYMEEYNEPRNALELFDKAYREQNDGKGKEAAYEMLAMYCFPEFKNIIEPDYTKAEYYCKEILDNEILPSAMYYVLYVLSQLWNNQNIDDSLIKERNNYLVQKYKCFAYVNKEEIEEGCNSLKNYLETICFNCIALKQFDEVNYYFDEIERFIENSNPDLMLGFRLGQGTKSYVFGRIYLENNMLAEAKKSFEEAKVYGREDADDYLRRFSRSLFGKLTFK